MIEVSGELHDGDEVGAGDVIATIRGPARGILTAERTALNFLCRLSDIASATASIVASVRGHRAHISLRSRRCRAHQRQSCRHRGRHSHRGGARADVVGHLVKIELEVDTLTQLEEALRLGVDAVLLDNMTVDEMQRAVAMAAGKAITEASGRVTPATAPAIAATGVDLISVGWLTHSAPILDIGLDDCSELTKPNTSAVF